jgi:hypothetical protein
MVGGRIRRRRDLRPAILQFAGWAAFALVLGWLVLAGLYGLMSA